MPFEFLRPRALGPAAFGPTARTSRGKKDRRYRPRAERLEDRTLPATLDIVGGALSYAGGNVANRCLSTKSVAPVFSALIAISSPREPVTKINGVSGAFS